MEWVAEDVLGAGASRDYQSMPAVKSNMTVATLTPGAVLPMAVAFILLGHHFWRKTLDPVHPTAYRELVVWTCKGLAVPIASWFVLNSGILPGVPILVPDVALIKAAGGKWLSALMNLSGPALFVTTSYWAATTIAWLLGTVAVKAKDPKEFWLNAGFWSLFLLPVSGSLVVWTGLEGLGFGLLIWLTPILHVNLSMAEVRTLPPSYAAVIAKLKFGKYHDAETQILRELERCEDDFDGWLMLADLYAHHFNDLGEADRTIRELCAQPNVNGVQISLALNRLADWHLKLADDPESARSALEEICRRLPGTHATRMARQRLDQLPATREELLEKRKPRKFRLPALSDTNLAAPNQRPAFDPLQAKIEADRCVARLKQHPDDVETREKLAVLLAEEGKAGAAIEQVKLLLDLPDQPATKRAEWLAMIAVWQLKFESGTEHGRQTLERLVREYPGTPQAMAAQRRLTLLATELAVQEAGASNHPSRSPIKLVHFQN